MSQVKIRTTSHRKRQSPARVSALAVAFFSVCSYIVGGFFLTLWLVSLYVMLWALWGAL
jgi:fatty acid desaturase